MRNGIFCNQNAFVNNKPTLPNILASTDIVNEYLMEEDNTNIFGFEQGILVWYLIIVYKWKWKTQEIFWKIVQYFTILFNKKKYKSKDW